MSTVVGITVAGVDETADVMWERARFDFNQNGEPGTFEIAIRDINRTKGPYVNGSEVELTLDGDLEFGGYVTQVSYGFALPADELPTDSRIWTLRGSDWNILFDKRITFRESDPLTMLPRFHGDDYDGDLIIQFCNNWVELPAGFTADSSTIDNVTLVLWKDVPEPATVGRWHQQGTVWREQMELIAQYGGAVWYISADRKVHFHELETQMASFGFSDNPNGTSTIGYVDATATEDITEMVNDAFVWGGSEWTEDIVLGHEERTPSIDAHQRWQYAEHHFGEDSYKLQQGVTARAVLIVDGRPALVGYNPGKRFPQWEISFSWYGENVPTGLNHIRAGQLVSIDMTTFGGSLSPIILPCRSVGVSFVGVDGTGKGHVQFDGNFGLSLDDPTSLWGVLRQFRRQQNGAVAAARDITTASVYGSFGQFTPIDRGGGVYDLPNDIGYVGLTTTVYDNGLLLIRDTDYTETDPVNGEITLNSEPAGWLWVVCRTT